LSRLTGRATSLAAVAQRTNPGTVHAYPRGSKFLGRPTERAKIKILRAPQGVCGGVRSGFSAHFSTKSISDLVCVFSILRIVNSDDDGHFVSPFVND